MEGLIRQPRESAIIVYQDELLRPADLESCLVSLREVGISSFKKLVDDRTMLYINWPTSTQMSLLSVKNTWKFVQFLLGLYREDQSYLKPTQLVQADQFDKDLLSAVKVNYPYHITKGNLTLTTEELAIQKTQYSLEAGRTRIVYNPVPIQQLQTFQSKRSAYGRYCPIIQAHYSTSAMVNSGRYAMMDTSNEVKTCFDLPTSNFIYSLVKLSISTPTHLKDQNKVISIRDFDTDKIPNRLKGINNLFSNYGNVEKVGI